jgi:apolipoprotein N-acyltransferase
MHYLLRSRLSYLNILTPPSLWILLEYVREISDFSIPWYFIGYSQIGTPFIQSADIAGIYGISFLIVLTNYMLTMGISDINYRKLKFFIPFILLMASVFIYGIAAEKRNYNSNSKNNHVNITGVQGNTGSMERWDKSLSFINYQKYIDLTGKNFKGKGILIWPETVLNSSDRINFEIIQNVNTLIGNNTIFITGGTRMDKNGRAFNSIFVSNMGMLSYIYDKNILFPYSEKKIAGLSHGGVMGSPDTFTEGKRPPLFRSNIITPSLSICFESLYPGFIRKGVKEGADILINVANDSWFGNTYEPYMHFNSTIVRAIENRRSLARITNSGISALIDPAGKVTQHLGLNESGVITGELTRRKELTFYTIYGDLIIPAAALITAAAGIIYIRKSY